MINRCSILTRCFARAVKRPEFIPPQHSNYNFEQNPEYTKKYKRALVQKELLLKKLDEQIVPKPRKKIVKDINYSAENYQAWRIFDCNFDMGEYCDGFSFMIDGKFRAKPKDMIRAFGIPNLPTPIFEYSYGVFYFQDRNLDRYFVYNHDLDAQSVINTKSFEVAFNEFLKSEKETEFRIVGSPYCEKHRFKNYLIQTLEDVTSGKTPSFLEIVESKFGKIEMWDDYEKNHELKNEPAIYKYHRKQFEKNFKSKMDYIDDKEYDQPISPVVDIRGDPDTKKV